MNIAEVLKRIIEHLQIYISRIKYHNPKKWPYSRFVYDNQFINLIVLPSCLINADWKNYKIYNLNIDLTKSINWHFSENKKSKWPICHYSKIYYRPGNPYGDVRINWELNRLQFLPAMATSNEDLAKNILKDWMIQNPYVHGPAYLASMEVAIRWLSIYRTICLFKIPIEESLLKEITGLAVASGKFIESRLSTHSSAGNHLVVEAVGLFWIGKSLETRDIGKNWVAKARQILLRQVPRQINPDGSNQEQCFWYLGFVLDALFHYFLLEGKEHIPLPIWQRVESMLEFISAMTTYEGLFPDYGDRDDGFIFRVRGEYNQSPFPGLLYIGAIYYNRPDWLKNSSTGKERSAFWFKSEIISVIESEASKHQPHPTKTPSAKLFKDGGMTLMKRDKGKMLFRHSRLGLGNTCGHGHADALSITFSWQDIPVLIDLGSGQYNGDQDIRNFFRSTIAHNTIEIDKKNQAQIIGSFLWKKTYNTSLIKIGNDPALHSEASHDGYFEDLQLMHDRKVEWPENHQINISDTFSGKKGAHIRGAFHLGSSCNNIKQRDNHVEADFIRFKIDFTLPKELEVEHFIGSCSPFLGWCSTIYGQWQPIHSLIFSGKVVMGRNYISTIKIHE